MNLSMDYYSLARDGNLRLQLVSTDESWCFEPESKKQIIIERLPSESSESNGYTISRITGGHFFLKYGRHGLDQPKVQKMVLGNKKSILGHRFSSYKPVNPRLLFEIWDSQLCYTLSVVWF